MRADSITLVNTANGSSSGDMSGNLTFGAQLPNNANASNLGGLSLAQIFGYSIQANFLAGSPTGALKLQSSNDGTNWVDISGTSFTVSSTGSFLWNVSSPNYLYVRMVWTKSGSPSGTLTALAYVRGF